MKIQLYNRIIEKKKLLDSKRPLPKAVLERLREEFEIELTYNSNAIEGNTLTLTETRMVLEEGITIKGKPLKYHLEAKNHKEAIDVLERVINKNTKITESLINSIHAIILKDIEKEYAGKYRRGQVRILGADFIPPNWLKIPDLMQDLVKWISKNPDKLNIVEFAAQAHYRLAWIHPYIDGNGRVARLLMNMIFMKNGFPPVIILNNDRKKYISALRSANRGNFEPFYLLVAQAVERSLDLFLMAAGVYSGELIKLSELSKSVNFSAKYLNKLARTGKLEALKLGRDWLSSKEALARYLENRERKR